MKKIEFTHLVAIYAIIGCLTFGKLVNVAVSDAKAKGKETVEGKYLEGAVLGGFLWPLALSIWIFSPSYSK